MDDEKIVELYLNRDESAIRQTTDKYGRRLRLLADGIVKDHLHMLQDCAILFISC